MPDPYYSDDRVTVWHGRVEDVLPTLPDCSVDSVVCDPPYAFPGGFMSKPWDAFTSPRHFQEWCEEWARECYRILKPGGHLIAAGAPRCYHRLASGIEDAGFEVRDSIHHLFGAGFPKSLDVSGATLKILEDRYGDLRCGCLDAGKGRPAGDDVGREGREADRVLGGSGESTTEGVVHPELPVDEGSGDGGMRELRGPDHAPTETRSPGEAPVLREDVRGRRAEDPGLGDAPLRAGLAEDAGEDQGTGQGVPVVRRPARGDGAARPSSGAVPVWGDEPSVESGGAVRLVPPPDREDHRTDVGVDPGRDHPRRVDPDDHGGQRRVVARVCSWCGLPDPDWLDSLTPLGTALKPAHEPWVLARKPLVGTIAQNVVEHGTGALNIDGCRVAAGTPVQTSAGSLGGYGGHPDAQYDKGTGREYGTAGRWPANVVFSHADGCRQVGTRTVKSSHDIHDSGSALGRMNDDAWEAKPGFRAGYGDEDGNETVPEWSCAPGCPVAALDQQSGDSKSPLGMVRGANRTGGIMGAAGGHHESETGYGDSGGASRFFPSFEVELPEPGFFYCPKAPRSERPQATFRKVLRLRSDLTDEERALVERRLREAGVDL